MRRGFTILEMLVASMLLGMLMTILTMIFNQSSIAWRTGIAGLADTDNVRKKVSEIRYKADNAYVWKGQAKCVRSIFDDTGKLRTDRQIGEFVDTVTDSGWKPTVNNNMTANDAYGYGDALQGRTANGVNYIVNVMSAGPDREMDTYDDIWSAPDDPNEW